MISRRALWMAVAVFGLVACGSLRAQDDAPPATTEKPVEAKPADARPDETKVEDKPADAAGPIKPGPLPGHSHHGEVFDEGPRQKAYLMPGMPKIHFPV